MIFLAIAGSFALFLGLLLMLIGILFAAIYVMTIYLFILPIMMVEGPSIANTISRTIHLLTAISGQTLAGLQYFVIITARYYNRFYPD